MALSVTLFVVLLFFLLVTLSNCIFWPRLQPSSVNYSAQVSVLIPARNEEKNIADCLDTILLQGPIVSEILVYDDHSTDSTGQIIQSSLKRNSLIRQVEAQPLPVGWCGKNFACHQLAKEASGEWLLFIDADARLASHAINSMLAEVQARNATFLSCWPKFEMYSFAEKVLMPFLNFVVLSLYPAILASIKRPDFQFNSKLGLAHGACMLFERASYESFGGHQRVKDQIFEDTRIAQLWREDRRVGVCLDGQSVVSLRMYTSFSEIWFGFQKNFFPAFTFEVNFWLFLLTHLTIFLFPFYLLHNLTIYSVMPASAILILRAVLLLRFKHSFWSLIFHPLGELIVILLGLSSWWRCKSGNGVRWKGRAYQKSI